MPSPPAHERRALTIVLSVLIIDMIGFGIVLPVMPDLIVGLTHTTLGDAARMSGWLMGVFAIMQFMFGPVLGGLLGSFGTRAPFFVAGGLALINAAAGFFLLPESLSPERRRPFALSRANPLGTFRSLARHKQARPLFVAWFLWILAHQAYPSTWAFFTKLKFGWSDHAVGLSLAYAGLTMALAQAFVTRRLIPRIGERKAILLGLSIGMAGFLANALVPYGWMLYAVSSFAALQGLVFPSMNSTLSKLVEPNEQGELQGGVASMQSVAAIIGPLLMTSVLARFTRAGGPVWFPGAAYVLSSLLALASLIVVITLARGVFARVKPA